MNYYFFIKITNIFLIKNKDKIIYKELALLFINIYSIVLFKEDLIKK